MSLCRSTNRLYLFFKKTESSVDEKNVVTMLSEENAKLQIEVDRLKVTRGRGFSGVLFKIWLVLCPAGSTSACRCGKNGFN